MTEGRKGIIRANAIHPYWRWRKGEY